MKHFLSTRYMHYFILQIFFFFFPWLHSPAYALASSTKSGWISWRLLNNFLFYTVGLLAPRPTPSRRTRPLYLYPPEAGWLPILVASYDTHELRWDYSHSPVTTRGHITNKSHNFSVASHSLSIRRPPKIHQWPHVIADRCSTTETVVRQVCGPMLSNCMRQTTSFHFSYWFVGPSSREARHYDVDHVPKRVNKTATADSATRNLLILRHYLLAHSVSDGLGRKDCRPLVSKTLNLSTDGITKACALCWI
jgi:hypothetical protein